MQKQIFPTEITENTSEVYLNSVSVRGQIIYTVILLMLITFFVVLPFIKVDVSVNSRGIVRSISEKNEVKSLVSGILAGIDVTENQSIKQGDTLFKLVTELSDDKLRLNTNFINEKMKLVIDLQNLVNIKNNGSNINTFSGIYTQQYNQFKLTLLEKNYQKDKAEKHFQRQDKLLKEKVIAVAEWEDAQFGNQKAQAEYNTLIASQTSQWQNDLQRYNLEIRELQAQNQQVTQEKKSYIIKAPVSGTIQQVVGKYIGSSLQVGEVLGVISPDSSLIVECYVSPSDIGLLKSKMKANFQIDAFDYNQWGLVVGEVMDISQDFVIIQEKPVFRIKCKLLQTELKLKNGFSGKLKKGMTVNARFKLTERSLWQLLYDKADNWLNPNI